MMRMFAAALLALAAACAPQQSERCDLTATRTIAFTAPDAEDRVTARSFGASCEQAIGVIEIVGAEGRPLWAWATPLPRAFGDNMADAEDMQSFLERWTQATVTATQAAPAWDALAPGQTTLDELTYRDIRARELPMLCHFSGTARELCVFWEPVAGGAGHFFDRDLEEAEQ